MSADAPETSRDSGVAAGARRVPVAILGSGNIGTDLLCKIHKASRLLEAVVVVGIDPESDGLAKAREMGVSVTAGGLDACLDLPEFDSVEIVFDATSAAAHKRHAGPLAEAGKQVIDLTPAAVGPFVVPVINLGDHVAAPNLNMVSCGGQATIPVVGAISAVCDVHYAEIIASISSRSAGPGTRANIDEFTLTTALGLQTVGRAKKGKAIIILNPAEPPISMRDTIITMSDDVESDLIAEAVYAIVKDVQRYVPGYRLKQDIQFEKFSKAKPLCIAGYGKFNGIKTSVFLEVEGSGDYLPSYSGNLDIMTASALATAESIVERRLQEPQ